MAGKMSLPAREAAVLGAQDGIFFSHYFFPKTCRQDPAPFHPDIWKRLDGPSRYVAIEVFRGGAKTTLIRLNLARRICYGISRTILYLGKSEGKAVSSINWLASQVRRNELWANVFQLRLGEVDNKLELEVFHGAEGHSVRIIGMGIEGSVRGTNVEDYRPDFIVLDDVLDESNCSTLEQRNKILDRIEGAVKRSLAPRADSPLAKMAFINTPMDQEDPIELAMNDPEYDSLRISCFKEDGESAWPALYPTQELRDAKQAAIYRNRLSIWLREMECLTVADEKRYFKVEWLQYWTTLPERMTIVAAIDPSPPKDEEPDQRKKKDPDPEVLVVMGRWGRSYYLIQVTKINDPDPEKTWTELKSMKARWPLQGVAVETVAFQKTLEWYLKRRMHEERNWLPITKIDSKINKVKRIRQRFSSLCPDGSLWVHGSQTDFIEEYRNYPEVRHDDELDAVEMACQLLDNLMGIPDKSKLDDYDNEAEASYPENESRWAGACP